MCRAGIYKVKSHTTLGVENVSKVGELWRAEIHPFSGNFSLSAKTTENFVSGAVFDVVNRSSKNDHLELLWSHYCPRDKLRNIFTNFLKLGWDSLRVNISNKFVFGYCRSLDMRMFDQNVIQKFVHSWSHFWTLEFDIVAPATRLFDISDIIGMLRGYAIRSGRRPEGSQRPQGGPPRPLTSRGTSAWPYRVTTQYSFYPVQLYS